jgi:hypothetical protein
MSDKTVAEKIAEWTAGVNARQHSKLIQAAKDMIATDPEGAARLLARKLGEEVWERLPGERLTVEHIYFTSFVWPKETLEQMAERLQVTPRRIQQILEAEGTNWSEMKGRAGKRVAD